METQTQEWRGAVLHREAGRGGLYRPPGCHGAAQSDVCVSSAAQLITLTAASAQATEGRHSDVTLRDTFIYIERNVLHGLQCNGQ